MRQDEVESQYDLAGVVIGLAMKVHRVLGAGFLEIVYQKALQHELIKDGFSASFQTPIKVVYDGVIVGDYIADLVVNDELIVEIKAIQMLTKIHEAQLVNYLKAIGKNEGLLLNFGAQSLEFKRKFRNAKKTPPDLQA